MLRVTLCLIAVLAAIPSSHLGVEAVDFRNVVAELPYRQYFRQVRQGVERVSGYLLGNSSESLEVTDPALHYLVLLGVVNSAAERYYIDRNDDNATALLVYRDVLNKNLALVYQDPVSAGLQLRSNLNEVQKALQPLTNLVDSLCQNLDDKDCDKTVQLEVNGATGFAHSLLVKAVNVLRTSAALSRRYLKLQERLLATANRYSSLGYVLNRRKKLSGLGLLLGQVLTAARGLL